jgi:hypothetical protein
MSGDCKDLTESGNSMIRNIVRSSLATSQPPPDL